MEAAQEAAAGLLPLRRGLDLSSLRQQVISLVIIDGLERGKVAGYRFIFYAIFFLKCNSSRIGLSGFKHAKRFSGASRRQDAGGARYESGSLDFRGVGVRGCSFRFERRFMKKGYRWGERRWGRRFFCPI